MTTVAYNRGILACDSQTTESGGKFKCKAKAVETEDFVYVGCGTLVEALRFIDWLVAGKPELEDGPPNLKKTDVIEFNKKTGKVRTWEDGYPIILEDRLCAWGSGRDYAIGAMAAGSNPRHAVEIASKWDVYTGLGIQVFVSDAAAKRTLSGG